MQIISDKDLQEAFTPVCPHCERELHQIIRIEDDKGWFKGHLGYCYACPNCRKVLGFADYSSS